MYLYFPSLQIFRTSTSGKDLFFPSLPFPSRPFSVQFLDSSLKLRVPELEETTSTHLSALSAASDRSESGCTCSADSGAAAVPCWKAARLDSPRLEGLRWDLG